MNTNQNNIEIKESEKIGGTDNWGKININYIRDAYSKNADIINTWEHGGNNPCPIILDYYIDSCEGDGILVDNITYQEYGKIESDDYEEDEILQDGDNIIWCKCTKKSNGALLYTAISGNPYGSPRIAYFKHKTKDKTIFKNNIEYNVLSEWYVTIIQKPNPNVNETYLNDLGEKKYSVGIISDLHFNFNIDKNQDITDKNIQYKSDLFNALEYFKDNNVKFVSCLGDLAENNINNLYKFSELYTIYGYNNNLRLFSCLGEYDYMNLYGYNCNDKSYNETMNFNINKKYKDIQYFEYDGLWDSKNTGTKNIKSKTNFYINYKYGEYEDIYIYLSVDYGTTKYSLPNYLSRAVNKIDYNDKYVKEMLPFAIEAGYNSEIDGNFDYQFYNPNSLIWLKNIIENNLDKHIFLFMHHGLPHKAGNGTSYNKINDKKYFPYFSENKIWPYTNHYAIMKDIEYSGSNTLCGMQFYFLNYLNNRYKNVTWFSGHSHYSWKDGNIFYNNRFTGDKYLNFCNKDFNIYKPTGDEHYNNPANSRSISKLSYNPKIYSRAPLDENNLKDNPIGSSAWNIHIPSLTNSLSRYGNAYHSSEGAILDVHENGFAIREIMFRDTNSYSYINVEIEKKYILFE